MIYLYLSIILMFHSLDNLCNNCKNDFSEKKSHFSGKPITKVTKLDFGENELIISTKIINDSLLSGNLVLDIKVIGQELRFYKKNAEINTFIFKPKKIEISTVHVKKITVLENVIGEISILQGRNGWLYYIYGGGITGNQTEYYGLFTPEGQLIYYSYSTSRDKGFPTEIKGNLNSILKKYGIDSNLFLHPKHVTSVDY